MLYDYDDKLASLARVARARGQARKTKLYELLASFTKDDLCSLAETGAFNRFIMGYVRLATNKLEYDYILDSFQAAAVRKAVESMLEMETEKMEDLYELADLYEESDFHICETHES